MSVTVKIPTPLRKLTNGETSVDVDGSTISAVVESLETSFPGMRERLIDESGDLRHFVNIYLNGEDVRYLDGLNSSVGDRDELSIVPAVAGGQTGRTGLDRRLLPRQVRDPAIGRRTHVRSVRSDRAGHGRPRQERLSIRGCCDPTIRSAATRCRRGGSRSRRPSP